MEQLEGMLLDATRGGTSGRQQMARVTAIRTILGRRPRRAPARPSAEAEENARRALEMVNATRGPDAQLSELHPVDVATVLADSEWAALVRSDEEMAAMAETRARAFEATRDRRGEIP